MRILKDAKIRVHVSSEEVTRVVHCLRCNQDLAEIGNGKFDFDLALAAVDRHLDSAFVVLRRPHDVVTVNIRNGVVSEGVVDSGDYTN